MEGVQMFQGMRVVLSDGGSWSPARVHRKRANQGKASYHRRIQKKWLKRFGQVWVEIQKRGEVFKLGNHTLVVRREDWPELQRAAQQSAPY